MPFGYSDPSTQAESFLEAIRILHHGETVASIARDLTYQFSLGFGRYLDVDIEMKQFTFLPAARMTVYSKAYENDYTVSPYNNQWRQSMKIGRMVRKALAKDSFYTDADVEDFVNACLAIMNRDDVTLEIVSGDDIRFWYHQDHYASNRHLGDLRNSCMQHDECQPYFDLYAQNKNVSMLIAVDKINKLLGRCLLWQTTDDKVFDRIYAGEDVSIIMENYLYDNGYERARNGPRYVELDHTDFNYYPYLDTFCYLVGGVLTNREPRGGSFMTLTSTCGGFDYIGICTECGDTLDDPDSELCYYCATFECEICHHREDHDSAEQLGNLTVCYRCYRDHDLCSECEEVTVSGDIDENGNCPYCAPQDEEDDAHDINNTIQFDGQMWVALHPPQGELRT